MSDPREVSVELLRSLTPLEGMKRENLHALAKKVTVKQITALRFAGDDEFGALLERAARENLEPKAIKAAVRNWRADLHRT